MKTMYARAPHASQRLEVFSTSIVRTLSYCIGSWIRTNIGLIQSQGTCHLVYSDKAPGAGIEPTTFRVRAERSYLIVLAGNMSSFGDVLRSVRPYDESNADLNGTKVQYYAIIRYGHTTDFGLPACQRRVGPPGFEPEFGG